MIKTIGKGIYGIATSFAVAAGAAAGVAGVIVIAAFGSAAADNKQKDKLIKELKEQLEKAAEK